jgi:hypothetical protein
MARAALRGFRHENYQSSAKDETRLRTLRGDKGRLQIRKTDRRDGDAGGEKSCRRISAETARTRGMSPAGTGVAVGAGATVGAEITNGESWAGSPEIKQQDVFSAAATRALPASMSMPSHWIAVRGGVHPIRLDEKNEEAETGTTPSPATVTVNTRMNNRRIDIQSTKFSSCNLYL